jgi:hypothetical protein
MIQNCSGDDAILGGTLLMSTLATFVPGAQTVRPANVKNWSAGSPVAKKAFVRYSQLNDKASYLLEQS